MTTATKSAPKKAPKPKGIDVRRVADLFGLARDPSRVKILLSIDERPSNVQYLCDLLSMSRPLVTHHLGLLKVSGIITGTRDGKSVMLELTDTGKRLVATIRHLGE